MEPVNIPHKEHPAEPIDKGLTVVSEDCPKPVKICTDGCEDTVHFDACELELGAPGRILQLDVTLREVCPERRVALAVILTEVDKKGCEHKRGLKTLVVPAHKRECPTDVTVKCINFVLPEELDVTKDEGRCGDQRNFKARFIAHYIDSDFQCCSFKI